MDKKNLEEFLKKIEALPEYNPETHTDLVIEHLPLDEKYRFVLVADIESYEPPQADPLAFPNRREYREHLIKYQQEFYGKKLEPLMNYLSSMQVDIVNKKGLFLGGMIAANLTSQQAKEVKKSNLIQNMFADIAFDPRIDQFEENNEK